MVHETLPLPVVVITGAPDWAGPVYDRLVAGGCEPLRLAQIDTAVDPTVDRLIDLWPALVLVDGAAADWRAWVTLIKTRQATRRIPVVVVGDDPALAADAADAGAEATFAVRALRADALAPLQAHGRLLDPAAREQLACQCADPLPPQAEEGLRLFAAGAYYAQHDAFEVQWMAEEGPVRDLYRVILQVGVAYFHITRGNHAGALKMLQRSVQWFATLPDVCQGVDVRQFRADAARVRAALRALDPAQIDQFDRSLLRPVPRIAAPGSSSPSEAGT